MWCINVKGRSRLASIYFFFNDTATTEIYTLSLHDPLPISETMTTSVEPVGPGPIQPESLVGLVSSEERSEEHTSELQSQSNLVCRLLLEKKKKLSSQRAPTADNASTILSTLPIIYTHSHTA